MIERTPGRSRRVGPLLRVGLGVSAGALLLVMLARSLDLAAVAAALARASPWPLAAALLALALDFMLRAVRFWLMLRAAGQARVPFAASVAPFIASFGVSNLLPLRIGDGLRVVWFVRRFDLPVGTVVGAMIVERVFDLTSLLLVAVAILAAVDGRGATGLVNSLQLTALLGAGVVFAMLLAPATLHILGRLLLRHSAHPWCRIAAGAILSTADAIRQIGAWRRLLGFLALSMLVWVLESGLMIGAWVSLGGSPGQPLPPLLSSAFATLATVVPSLPGQFGPFEYAGVQAFGYAGVDRSFGAAVVLVSHLVLWAPITLFAIVWLLVGGAPAARSRRTPGRAPLQA